MCDGVAIAPHRFPAHSLSPLRNYLSTKICNFDFVEEAGFDGKLAGFLPWNVTSDNDSKETRSPLASQTDEALRIGTNCYRWTKKAPLRGHSILPD